MIDLKREHRRILVELLRREKAIAEAPSDPFDVGRIRSQRRHGPCWQPGKWFADAANDPTTQKRYLRALHQLADAELVHLHSSGGVKITHARLSDAGRTLLEEVAAATSHPVGGQS